VAIDTLLLRLVFPAAAVGAAADAATNGWGLLQLLDAPAWLAVPLAMLALDLAIYGQHRLSHVWPPLWRLHRVHHCDLDIDVSTALRFHPLEILLSMLYKIAAVYLLGAPPLAVLLFEMLLTGCAMFNHSNLRLPARADAALRRLLVTPDMHRVHHSTRRTEHDSNFGFSLSCWDHLFASYRAQPAGGHGLMRIGLDSPRDSARCASLAGLLRLPFAADHRRDTQITP